MLHRESTAGKTIPGTVYSRVNRADGEITALHDSAGGTLIPNEQSTETLLATVEDSITEPYEIVTRTYYS